MGAHVSPVLNPPPISFPIPLSCSREPALSDLLHASNLHWSSILCMVIYMFLEREMATHSSVLAWRTPWTEEPVRPQFMGSQESDMTYQLNHHHHHHQYTCFSAMLSNPPTLAFSHRVQKSVLYICVSSAALHVGSSLASF